MLIAGLLLFIKYSDKEASRDADTWTENQRTGNLAGEVKDYEMRELVGDVQKDAH